MCFHTIPKTLNKYSIKIYSVIDVLMFYTYNMGIYEGMQPDGPFFPYNKPRDVVNRLTTPINNTNIAKMTNALE
jgi:hypothetical protein